MRVTSPPKHHSQFQRVSSPIRNGSTLSNLSNQMQQNVHQLKSPQRTGPLKTQNITMRQSLYAQLKNRDQEYGEIIKQLNKENRSLKAQLGNVHFQQSNPSSFSTILSVSPHKINMNKTIGHQNSETFVFRNLENNRVMNQTFSGFNPQKIQPSDIVTVRPNLSPFAKKCIVVSQASPTGYRPGVVTVLSPSKRTIRPVSNVVQMSYPVIIRSPQKRSVNHSYHPSLVSFKYPSQQQSLDCSPKKSFQSIMALDSQIFSSKNNSQCHVNGSSEEKLRTPVPNSNFFDMKKRQLNYGSIFEKEKSSQSSKTIHTTLKIQTKNFLQNQVQPLKIIERGEDEAHLNPSNTKRHKKDKSFKEEKVETEPQGVKDPKPQQFNLKENIESNPLLNMLKNRLQEEVNFLNTQNNESQQAEIVSLYQSSGKNPNIRYSGENSQTSTPNKMIHPLKRNIFQSFPLLHQLRNAQNKQNEQISRQVIENQVNLQNQHTQESLGQKDENSRSRLSDKIQRQNASELVIEEVPISHRAMTIMRMLEETRRIQNLQEQKEEREALNEDEEAYEPVIDLIAMDHESIEQETQNHEDQVIYNDSKHEKQDQCGQQEQPDIFAISNKYYCQNTEENQSLHSSSAKHLPQFQQEAPTPNKSFKPAKNVLIDENYNVSRKVSSKRILGVLQQDQTSQRQINLKCIQVEGQKIYESQSSPCKFYDNPNEIESQKVPLAHRLNQSAQYQTFYINKKNKDCDSHNENECKRLKGAQKYQESRLSDAWSQNSLRSQRFKKISNRAYL